MTMGPSDRRLAWGCLLFLVAAAWRWAGLKRADALFFTVAAASLLALYFLSGRRPLKQDAFFWLGLLFLAYLGLQWWNTGRELQYDADARRWLYSPPPHPRLPWSFTRREAAQMLYWFFPAWVLALCLRAPGMTRKHLGLVMRGLVFTGGALALCGAVQFLSGSPHLIWRMPPRAISFASFGYANHAAAYFLLLAGVAAGLLFRQVFRRDRPMSRLTVAGLAVSLALCLAGANLSLSRGGILLAWLLAAFTAAYGMVRGWRLLRPAARVHGLVAAAVVGTALYFAVLGVGGRAIRGEFTPRRRPAHQLVPGLAQFNLDLSDRPRLWKAAWSAFKDYPLYGTGGWGFRYVVAFYLPPEEWDYLRNNPGRANVHCDPLQFLAEFGLAGGGLMALAAAALTVPLLGRGGRRGAVFTMSCAGLLLVAAFSLIDLPFRCPAVLWTWTAVLAALPGLTARGPSPELLVST